MALLQYKTEGVSDLSTPGFVYFIQGHDGGLVKIGWATDPKARMAKMQAHCPVVLRILHSEPGNGRDERTLHEQFSKDRQHGEWFNPSAELLAEIEQRRGRNEEKLYVPAVVRPPRVFPPLSREVDAPRPRSNSFKEAQPGSKGWGRLAAAMESISWK